MHVHLYVYIHVHMHVHTFTLTHTNTYIQYIGANNRSGQVKLKPVVDYNHHMLGVDKLDQFASYYSFLHKSVMVEEDLLDARCCRHKLVHHL